MVLSCLENRLLLYYPVPGGHDICSRYLLKLTVFRLPTKRVPGVGRIRNQSRGIADSANGLLAPSTSRTE
jgi:hypothetical protein